MAESQIFEQARRRREKMGVFGCCFFRVKRAAAWKNMVFETLNKNNTMFSAAAGGEKIGFLEILNHDF